MRRHNHWRWEAARKADPTPDAEYLQREVIQEIISVASAETARVMAGWNDRLLIPATIHEKVGMFVHQLGREFSRERWQRVLTETERGFILANLKSASWRGVGVHISQTPCDEDQSLFSVRTGLGTMLHLQRRMEDLDGQVNAFLGRIISLGGEE